MPSGATIYKRPQADRLREVDTDDIACVCCGARWRLGTRLCLTCWEPLHFRAVADTFPRMRSKDEVA